jgi:hypothetical protein
MYTHTQQVVKVLNAHHHSLHWLESSARKLDTDLAAMTRQLSRADIS